MYPGLAPSWPWHRKPRTIIFPNLLSTFLSVVIFIIWLVRRVVSHAQLGRAAIT